MKIQELFEAIDPELEALFKKHGLTPNRAGTAVNDFNFTGSIGDEFKAAGYELSFNQKTQKFDVRSAQAQRASNNDDEIRSRVKNVTGRTLGFVPRRKMK